MSSPVTIAPATAGTAPAHAKKVLGTLILVAAVANLPLAVANVALPSIGAAFDASQTQLNMVAVGYSLGLAASVLWFGAVGDRYGRKMMLLLGVALSLPAGIVAGVGADHRGADRRPHRRRSRRRHGVPDHAGTDHRAVVGARAVRSRSPCGRPPEVRSRRWAPSSPGSCSSISGGARSSSSRSR